MFTQPVCLTCALNQEKKRRAEEGQELKDNSDKQDKKERIITIRALNMEDFKEAKNQVK